MHKPEVEVGQGIIVAFGALGDRMVRVSRIARTGTIYVVRSTSWGGERKPRPVYWDSRIGRFTINKPIDIRIS